MEMASTLLKTPSEILKISKPSLYFPLNSGFRSSRFQFPAQQQHCHYTISFSAQKPSNSRPKPPPLSLHTPPPTSKQEAILQARTCLSKALEKPLNNPSITGKIKKIRQPKFRVEIPIIDDDSPSSITRLALEVIGSIPIAKKGQSLKIALFWPNPTFTKAAIEAFKVQKPSNQFQHMSISAADSDDTGMLNSADLAVVLAPEASQLGLVRTITEGLSPRPVVIFNPRWRFEEEENFGELKGFVGSFEALYSFLGLEVKGLISRKKGVVFRCVEDGILSNERWEVLIEEEGELRVVSKFKARPTIGEVENVLYNKMAINSPLTKSAKFLRDLVSTVTGRK